MILQKHSLFLYLTSQISLSIFQKITYIIDIRYKQRHFHNLRKITKFIQRPIYDPTLFIREW